MNLFKFTLLSTLLLLFFSACTPKDTVDFLAGDKPLTNGDTNKIVVEVAYEKKFGEIFGNPNNFTRTVGDYEEKAMILSNEGSVQIIVRKTNNTTKTTVEVKKSYSFIDAGSTILSMTIADGTNQRTTFRSANELTTFMNKFKTLDDFYNYTF